MRLAEKRIVVTRAREDAEALARALEEEGAIPIYLPAIVRCPAKRPALLSAAWKEAASFDRVLVGSPYALLPFETMPCPAERIAVACVGAKTAASIRGRQELARRFEVAEVAEARRAEGLALELARSLGKNGRLEGRRFLFPRPPEGRTVLIEQLTALGAHVEAVEAYSLGCAAPASDAVRRTLDNAAAYTFLSGRTLECFFEVIGEAEARARLDRSVVAVIGPVASERAQALGVRVDVVPETASVEALIEALIAHFEAR